MMLDKGWVGLHRADPEYEKGAWNFVKMVTNNLGNPKMILCPCIDCRNVEHQCGSTVVEHLVTRGMDAKYKQSKDWYEHGAAHCFDEEYLKPTELVNEDYIEPTKYIDADDFIAKLKDAETPLYPNCSNYNKLSAIVALYQLKTQSGWSNKRKRALIPRKTSKVSEGTDKNVSECSEACQQTLTQQHESHEPNLQHIQPSASKEVVEKDAQEAQESITDPMGVKKPRGPTKMRDIAVDAASRVHVEFTDKGEPCGAGSISLSSFLGPLVREHVPVTLCDWRKLGNDVKVILWRSIQARFDLDTEWQKAIVFKSMGCIWRASKSRLVSQIQEATNEEERLELQPKNIQSRAEWIKFIKTKTSPAFKAVSDKYKAMRRKQIPHTCSRKGLARLAEDMKKNSTEPSSVSRVKVWIKSRTRKDGKPVNTGVSETIEKLIEAESASNSTTNVTDDALSKVLGNEQPGRLRGMGRGMTISKLTFLQTKDKHVAEMQEQQTLMHEKIQHLEKLVNTLLKNKIKQSGEEDKTSPVSVNTKSLEKCQLLDWSGTKEIVAEGHLISRDPNVEVNKIPMGPNAIKVCVDISTKPDAFLWRPTSSMTCIEQAQGKSIAWPADRVILQPDQDSVQQDNIDTPLSKYNNSTNKCTLFDWSGKDEIVAEGRWHSSDPKTLINDIPLGPNAMIVWVDMSKNHDAFLWRPTSNITCIKDVIGSAIAWPTDKVVLEKVPENQEVENASYHLSVNMGSKKNCKLLDVSGSGQVVAEGRWFSSDPNQVVHHIPLGPNAIKVWVDSPKVPTASLWRPTSELEFIEDAIGTTVAWPADKVVMI